MERRGKTKLDVRFDDGSRGYATLPISWLPAQAKAIQDAVETIARSVATGSTLNEAVDSYAGKTKAAPSQPGLKTVDPLLDIWEAFGQYKVQQTGEIKQSTWDTIYGKTAQQLQKAQSAKDAEALLLEIGKAWDPGARSRQISCQHIAAMLKWAVGKKLLPADRWTPPLDLKPFVGTKLGSSSQSMPLTDSQILALLESLPNDAAGKRWQFVFQLLATYGLRPVEVLHLEIRPDGLWCNYQKRSGGGVTKPRRLKALHPEWETDWNLLDRIAADEPFPPFGGGVADAARRYLDRQQGWSPMKALGVTSYGFRHGFALRAHQQYGLSVRVTSALMGHSTETHLRHYGAWVDQDTVDAAVEAGIRYRQLTRAV